MKILLLTDRMENGGAETHIAQLARGLRALGASVTLLSAGGALADALEQEGIPQIRLPLCTHNPLRLMALRRALRRILLQERFDVLHAHARIPALLLRGLSPAKGKTAVTVHAHFRASPLLKRLCYWGDRSIAVCEDLRDDLCRRYRVPAERITVIPNGINCQRFSPAPSPDESAYLHRPLRVAFASRMDGDCCLGAELLCAAASLLQRRFPDLQITLAGGGNAWGRIRDLAGQVNRTLPAPILQTVGWVEDMPALLREQDIFVGVSRAAMEAAAVGCAVILCGNEGYLGILDHAAAEQAAQSNFCCRGMPLPKVEALTRDLLLLLSRPDLRQEAARQGQELIRSHFGADQMCLQTYALYQKLIPPPAPTATLLVGGYFGCGNMGDDAILLGFLEMMRLSTPQIRVLALTGHPRRDRRRFGIPCYGRKNPISLCYALSRADAFLCGGGSLLQNGTSQRSLSYYLTLLGLARSKKRPTVLYSAGIGPLYGSSAHAKVARALNRCAYISLRDPTSLRTLRCMGVDAGLLHLGGDPALLMPSPPVTRGRALLESHGLSAEKEYLAVILREVPGNAYLPDNLLLALRTVCRRHGLIPLFTALDRADRDLARRGAQDARGELILLREPADITALLRICRATVTLRLHGLILSSVAGTPALGISPHPGESKISAFAAAVGQPTLPPDTDSAAELVEILEELLQQPSLPPLLATALADQRKKIWKDLANILGMIYNKGESSTPRRVSP
ncbi:MAG: polysaccharide pyruvyl transferase family protein [Clostridia bacterium]|nr:polysaccharide pyruvyl transferase family protein [Clostridia bacterium]